MSEFTKEVTEKYKSLFKGYCFNFEGLAERTKEGFVKLVKDMGAKVSDDAEFTFVQPSYFQKKGNNTKDNLYDINYIIEAVENADASNLLNHKFAPTHTQVSNDEPLCYAARYIFKTDSCHKCYYEKVFCKECAKSNERPHKDTNQRTEAIHSIATDSSSKNQDEIPRTPKKKVGRLSKSPPKKKLKHSNDTDETLHECKSPEAIETVENNCSGSDTDSSNNSGKERNGESTKKKSKKINSPIKQRADTSNSNASSIQEDDDSSDSSINENMKPPQKVDKKRSRWIIPSKTNSPPPRNEKAVESSDEEFNSEIPINVEDQAYFRRKQWWRPHIIPEKEQCTFPNCSYEPKSHPTHYKPRKFLSLIEKKIIVKYLIIKNRISSAKGKTVYENMIKDGYLTHRTWETLRNCFRRTILKEISTYNLDKGDLQQFLVLTDKNF